MEKRVPRCLVHHDFGLTIVPSAETPPPVFVTVQHDGLNKDVFRGLFFDRLTESCSDLNALPLAMDIFRAASPRVGVIYNQFNRNFVETNVEPEDGYRDPLLKRYYDGFHAEIEKRLAEAESVHGPCLLLDLHGFADNPSYAPPGGYDAILGTRNRGTVRTGLALHKNRNSLDYQLRDALKAVGLLVFCPESEPIQEKIWRIKVSKDWPKATVVQRGSVGEDELFSGTITEVPNLPDRYNGGYLVRKHGNPFGHLAAAIQIELAYGVRQHDRTTNVRNEKQDKFIKAMDTLIRIAFP